MPKDALICSRNDSGSNLISVTNWLRLWQSTVFSFKINCFSSVQDKRGDLYKCDRNHHLCIFQVLVDDINLWSPQGCRIIINLYSGRKGFLLAFPIIIALTLWVRKWGFSSCQTCCWKLGNNHKARFTDPKGPVGDRLKPKPHLLLTSLHPSSNWWILIFGGSIEIQCPKIWKYLNIFLFPEYIITLINRCIFLSGKLGGNFIVYSCNLIGYFLKWSQPPLLRNPTN